MGMSVMTYFGAIAPVWSELNERGPPFFVSEVVIKTSSVCEAADLEGHRVFTP